MAEWRFAKAWTERELARRLIGLSGLALNFDAREREMVPENGWTRFHSGAVIAHEPPGPPTADGAFSRAIALIRDYEFSDPRIVTAHFDADAPLEGRRMLLELKVLGLHYLAGTVVDAVREEHRADETLWGFRYATLRGHIERGAEWFLLKKKHATGEVHFGIEALWQPGDLPNWWSDFGFRLLARRYQRAWHRLAYVRLRRMLGFSHLSPLPHPSRILHEGRPVEAPPVHVLARRVAPPELADEREERTMPMPVRREFAEARALGFGALAAMRSTLPPMLVARSRLHGRARALVPAISLAEMVVDKLPDTPPRTQGISLVARALSGGVCAALAVSKEARVRAAILGAGSAIGFSYLLLFLRRGAVRKLRVPGVVAGLAEDALAVSLGRAVAASG